MLDVRTPSPSLLLAIAVALGLSLTGCGSSAPATESGPLPNPFPNHSVDQIQDAIMESTDTLRTFSATARITVHSPRETQSFTARVRQRRSDSLFVRLSMMGIEGGRLLLTPDSAYFFDTRKGVLRVGSVTAVRRIFPAPIEAGNLFSNMLGVLAPESGTDWAIEADSSFYYLSGGNHSSEYVVDPTRWRVVRYERETEDGTILEKRHFSNFRPVNGVLIPHRLIFRRPTDNVSAVITYRDVTLNPNNLSFELDVPPQVPRRPFR